MDTHHWRQMEERGLFIDTNSKSAQHVNLQMFLNLLLLPVSFIYVANAESNHFSDCQQTSQFTSTVSAVLPSGAVRDKRFMNEALKNDPKHRQSCEHILPKSTGSESFLSLVKFLLNTVHLCFCSNQGVIIKFIQAQKVKNKVCRDRINGGMETETISPSAIRFKLILSYTNTQCAEKSNIQIKLTFPRSTEPTWFD